MTNPPASAPLPLTVGLRPLSLGDIVDQSVRAWRRNFGDLFKLFLALQLVQYAFGKFLDPQESIRAVLNAEVPSAAAYARHFAPTVILLLALWLTSWITAMVGGSMVVSALLRGKSGLPQALGRLRTRAGTLMMAYLQSILWFTMAFLLPFLAAPILLFVLLLSSSSNIPKFLLVSLPLGLLFSGLLVFVWLMLRMMLIPVVIAEEEGSAWKALRRAGELLSGRVAPGLSGRSGFRASLLLTIVFAVLAGVGMIAGLPVLFLHFLYANPFSTVADSTQVVPAHLLIPAELFQVILSSVFAPISASLGAVFYLDQRVRREGLDLEMRLNALRPSS